MSRVVGPMIDIQAAYETERPNDSEQLRALYAYTALLEETKLAFLGLRKAYGWDLPERLPDVFPYSFRYPSPDGSRFGPLASGTFVAHPGGVRFHRHQMEIALVVDRREGHDLAELAGRTLHWAYAFDLLYSANGKLGNRCDGVGLARGRFGEIEYNEDLFFGWIFRAELVTHYLMQALG